MLAGRDASANRFGGYMRSMLRFFVVLFWLTLSPMVQAQDIAARYYKVTLTIERDGKVIGTPVFITEPGATAIMTNGTAGYSFKTDVGSNGGLATSSITLSTDLYLAANDKWELFGNPTIFAPVGRDSEISITSRTLGTVKMSYRIEAVSGLVQNIQEFGKNKCTENRIAEWHAAILQPVSYLATFGGGLSCCKFCQGAGRCCSSGPICSDPRNCGSDGCCNNAPV